MATRRTCMQSPSTCAEDVEMLFLKSEAEEAMPNVPTTCRGDIQRPRGGTNECVVAQTNVRWHEEVSPLLLFPVLLPTAYVCGC